MELATPGSAVRLASVARHVTDCAMQPGDPFLMDFPIHIDTISMGLPIVYFKGSHIEFSKI